MRCECCDKLLNESEDSATFVESGNRVGMCTECRGHLPRDLTYTTRFDAPRASRQEQENEDSEYIDHDLYLGEADDD